MPRLFGAFLEERLDTCEQLCFIWFDGKTFKISKTLAWRFDQALWHAVYWSLLRLARYVLVIGRFS